MERIENWENIEAKGVSDFVRLPAGGYVCKIVNALEHTNEEKKTKSLKVLVDIAEGQFKEYFKKAYDNNTNLEKKWDNNSTKYIGLGENSLPFFKGFITAVENSNPGYKWNWDEKTLIGKKIGGVYQYEEYEKQDGSRGIKVKLNAFRTADKAHEAKTDNIKLLNGSFISYDDYQERKDDEVQQLNDLFGDAVVEISDEEMPF